jgi:hypothetical protein
MWGQTFRGRGGELPDVLLGASDFTNLTLGSLQGILFTGHTQVKYNTTRCTKFCDRLRCIGLSSQHFKNIIYYLEGVLNMIQHLGNVYKKLP